MKVYFSQIYIRPGVSFPFSHNFQKCMSKEVTAVTVPSAMFIEKYGRDFDLIFRMSAKNSIRDNEIRGPTVFKKEKQIEYSIFLPYDVIANQPNPERSALEFLLSGVRCVFDLLGIDATKLVERQRSIAEKICSDPKMFDSE